MIFLTIVVLSLLHATSGAPGFFDLLPEGSPMPTDGLNRFSDKVSIDQPSGQNSSSAVPSSTVPSSTVSSSVVPSSTVPSSTVSSSVVPSSTVPSSTAPSSVVPSSTVPSSTVPSSMVPWSEVPQDPVEYGEKALASLFSKKVIQFNHGPYFPTEPQGEPAKLIKELSFSNFSLITSGKTIDKGADFWIEKELFKTDETIEAERITGVVGLPLQLFEGYCSILTTRSTDWHECKVIGSSREFSPVGKDYDYVGNPGIKILFQDTVVKKPFPYVVNDYMIDASTRPIYSQFNGTIDQPFHFDYHIDPSCEHGFNVTELAIVERAIDSSLEKLLRPVIMDFVRKSYLKNVIAPYASSIGAKVEIDAESQPKLSTFRGPPV